VTYDDDGTAAMNFHSLIQKENPLSLRERAREREYKSGNCLISPPLPNPLPEGEGVKGVILYD
jgi:hypothetical protein